MKYSEFSIQQLKEKLLELSMKNSTPKKYAWPMFEAYEVIRQLQKVADEIRVSDTDKPAMKEEMERDENAKSY